MTVTGTIKVKGETTEVGAKGFKKREFVITDNTGKFAQYISLQLTGDRCALLDAVGDGDEVTAHINIRGREWNSPSGEVKYFNTLEVWKLDVNGQSAQSPEQESDLPF